MKLSPDDIDALIRANSAAIGLPIADAHLPGVRTYFALAAQMAALVEGLALTPHQESGSVFVPVSPPTDSQR